MKKCPYCAEEIQDEVIFCGHCGKDLNTHTEMPKQRKIDSNTQYLAKTTKLLDLKHQQEKARPATYFLLTIILLVLFIATMGSLISFLVGLFCLASLLAGITAILKKSALGNQIKNLQDELNYLEVEQREYMPSMNPVSLDTKGASSDNLAELKTMLDRNLISQEEYTEKRKEILNRL